MLIILNNKN